MQKEKSKLCSVMDRIRNSPPHETTALLREAIGIAVEMLPCITGVFVESRYEAFDDMESLLSKLPNKLETVYNNTQKRILVFASDISEARMGYEAVHPRFPVSMRSAMKEKNMDIAGARALFLYIPPYERADSTFRAENAVLLNPSHFSSMQLKTAVKHFEPGCIPLLWETQGVKFGALAEMIRGNDREELEYLLARREIEASETEKDRQLRYILSFLEAMTEQVDDGKE